MECKKGGNVGKGKLFFNVWYDPTIFYEGEMNFKAIDICLHNKNEKISYYGGQCPNRNVFSYFDAPAENTNCQFI